MNITVDISQLKDLSNKLKKAGPKTVKIAELELKASANDAVRVAKEHAPIDMGGLWGKIATEPITKQNYKIGANVDYAAYVEFGTGAKAQIPPEWVGFAAQFKSRKKESWDKGLEDIKLWCARHGIPEEAAYPIFMSILNKGVQAQPFLYPGFKYGRRMLIKRLEQVIKDFNLE